jgi:hypothetical protein
MWSIADSGKSDSFLQIYGFHCEKFHKYMLQKALRRAIHTACALNAARPKPIKDNS